MVGVSRCLSHNDMSIAKVDLVQVSDELHWNVLVTVSQHDTAVVTVNNWYSVGQLELIVQVDGTANVIGMHVRVENGLDLNAEPLDLLNVAIRLLEHRIDNDGLLGTGTTDNVGVGAADWVEQLAENELLLAFG